MNFRFCPEFIQPVSEPDICVAYTVIAFRILRNFGHLITNLNLEYQLFAISPKRVGRVMQYTGLKLIEHYLAEYCSESLRQISLEGTFHDVHIILEDIQKPFINVTTLHIEACAIGKELPFNKVFPNLKTLKLGYNIYKQTSAIRYQFNTVENFFFLDFFDWVDKFTEEDIEEMLKLNPQFKNPSLFFKWKYSSHFIARIQQYCPYIQSYEYHVCHNLLNFLDFFYRSRTYDDRKTFTGFTKLNPVKISDKYKNTLQEIFDLYEKRYPFLTSFRFED